ncbi:hypothetical protein KV112_04420 [Mycolicibacter sp. MYC123]|uniref:Uncharacterized protein n=1 Tax=[Mycobacterium] zoologicum TaxID=2872311 RepID=A0ABU5YG16_9MYCO|nr:hypothetical protein [Mycolicibacter sp. MYC123]MEB3048993.1 hypothetical protein [Mycolicibacter sp. MYC123]
MNGDVLRVMWGVVLLTFIGLMCGWWSLIVIPAIIAFAVVRNRRLEMLRRDAENARADYDAAVRDLDCARAELDAAQQAKARARDALRGAGWLVADESVALN